LARLDVDTADPLDVLVRVGGSVIVAYVVGDLAGRSYNLIRSSRVSPSAWGLYVAFWVIAFWIVFWAVTLATEAANELGL
jgi:hypothetical protein